MVVDSTKKINSQIDKYYLHFSFKNQYVDSRCCGSHLPNVFSYDKMKDKIIEITCGSTVYSEEQFINY